MVKVSIEGIELIWKRSLAVSYDACCSFVGGAVAFKRCRSCRASVTDWSLVRNCHFAREMALRKSSPAIADVAIADVAIAESSHPINLNIVQLRWMIKCVLPKSSPLHQFIDYGCYCGLGGSGTPVDDLDRCCQTHDNCYGAAEKIKDCTPILDNPYTEIYKYTCYKNTITCSSTNNACKMFVCECDRNLANCMSKVKFNPDNVKIDQSRCK
ncbi:phospholipase A2-like [Mobula birostris]|uniref:phospholipase A2-like n=1 Tax=Mobula birostris TaxID=1983395 RepID=UPI003B28760C